MPRPLIRLELSNEAKEDPHSALVARVAASQCFQSSTRLKEFLFYVADCALRKAPEEATEQHIGINVFHRLPGYNSGEDSIVRTQARALRQKLDEYFNHEGEQEETVIVIPKGHYLPVFQPRHSSVNVAQVPLSTVIREETGAQITPMPPAPPIESRTIEEKVRPGASLLLYGSILIAALAGIWFFHAHKPSAIDRLWGPFLSNNDSLVIYSNAVFTGDSTNGLRYAVPEHIPQDPLSDHYVVTYTGIGELSSVYDLTRLFDKHHSSFKLKRSLLVTWDEAQISNLIFIGSVAENPSLRMLPPDSDFTMTAEGGAAGFINHHPKVGEEAFYGRPEHPFLKDYAMLALLPGLRGDKKMLVFSGLTTLGTQAAVEFATRPDTLDQLLTAVSDPKGEVRPFEALIETTIGGGVPLQTKLISVHRH
jgi:hypothetical protein